MEKIVKVKQLNIHKILKENYSKKESMKSSKEKLPFYYVMQLMKHSSYKRNRGGAIKQLK